MTLVVTLYTSRVVLNALGIEDFGIYNIVAGIVTMMAFLSGAMSSATQRFLSFELGKNNLIQLHNVFKMSINIHFMIVIIVVFIAETIGVWFVNHHLVIPLDRLDAANWVFQCALLSFCCSVMAVPYNAAIIAYEKMSAFAYISIIDVLLKLSMVFLLQLNWGDRLETYGLLMALVSFLNLGCYYSYSRYHFAITRFQLFWNTSLFKTLFSYTGWNLFGNLAAVTANQGVNILLNLFFGATVNAARAIAFQVNSAVIGFVASLQMSINPQIIKSYATDDKEYMLKLVFSGAKYSFFLLYLIAVPLLLQTNVILTIWLGDVPNYTADFCRLVIIDSLIMSLSGTIMTAFQATGKIKKYQIVVGLILMCNLPLSYIFLSFGYDARIPMVISILVSLVALLFRVFLLSQIFDKVVQYFLTLIYRVVVFFCGALFLSYIIPIQSNNKLLEFTLFCIAYWCIALFFIFVVGLERQERMYLKVKCMKLIKR
ncbi:hypothetical protein [Photobacterium phosphoreum]|uniref:hypothetical protein n=1 Tax=Photobacterium phosphoreum TaxID=659 RepID=UPI001C62F290|nr:hypothetical protein [Photobacterium phosphoreum]